MTRKRKWIVVSIVAFCICFVGILVFMNAMWNLKLFLYPLTSREIIIIFLCALCCSRPLISNFLNVGRKRKAPVISFLIWTFILSSICIFVNYLFKGEPTYHVFHSPESENSIVIEESSFLLAGYGNIYVKENALFMKKVKGYNTDDGYRPFENNDFELKWEKDRVTIIYGYGNGSQSQEEIEIYFD